MLDSTLVSKVKSLSAADRLELIGEVWETLSPQPVSGVEKALIDARLADLEARPEAQSPWNEVQSRLKRSLP